VLPNPLFYSSFLSSFGFSFFLPLSFGGLFSVIVKENSICGFALSSSLTSSSAHSFFNVNTVNSSPQYTVSFCVVRSCSIDVIEESGSLLLMNPNRVINASLVTTYSDLTSTAMNTAAQNKLTAIKKGLWSTCEKSLTPTVMIR